VNRKRFETYWAFQSTILAKKIEVFHEFMKAMGVNPEDPVQGNAGQHSGGTRE